MYKLKSINPATEEILCEVQISSEEEIVQKVKKAQSAKKGWKEIGVLKRVEILRKAYKAFEKRKNELKNLIVSEIGMPLSVIDLIEINSGLDYFKWYLENAEKYLKPEVTFEDEKTKHTVYFEPLGVAAVITAWNFPFSNFVWSVIPNLLAGNTVVFKHSEECPLSGKMIEEIMKLPEGVFSEVYGDGKTGDCLVHQDINLVSFTGSTKVGEYLYKVGAEKFIKVLMEMGGSAPGIVFSDANLDEVAELIYFNRFANSGQVCDGLKRLIVHKDIERVLVEKLKNLLETKIVGVPNDPKTDIGPLVAKRQLELLEEQVKDAIEKGAKVVMGGERLDRKGFFYAPTILTNINKDMRVWKEEVFGPVLPIVNFETEEESIFLANDTKYGLGSYIFTKDKMLAKRVASLLETGMVAVNSSSYLNPADPWGGFKYSGMGREHGKYGLQELTQIKVVADEK